MWVPHFFSSSCFRQLLFIVSEIWCNFYRTQRCNVFTLQTTWSIFFAANCWTNSNGPTRIPYSTSTSCTVISYAPPTFSWCAISPCYITTHSASCTHQILLKKAPDIQFNILHWRRSHTSSISRFRLLYNSCLKQPLYPLLIQPFSHVSQITNVTLSTRLTLRLSTVLLVFVARRYTWSSNSEKGGPVLDTAHGGGGWSVAMLVRSSISLFFGGLCLYTSILVARIPFRSLHWYDTIYYTALCIILHLMYHSSPIFAICMTFLYRSISRRGRSLHHPKSPKFELDLVCSVHQVDDVSLRSRKCRRW